MSREINCKAVLKDNAISCKASLGQTVIVTEGPEKYTPAPITPSESQQTIPTKDKQLTADVVVEPIPSEYIIPTGTEEINVTENGTVSRDVSAKETVTVNTNVPIPPGYIIPTGNLGITENGQYDVTEKASVTVDVPAHVPTGTKQISITENGTTVEDVAGYANAEISVDVPIPPGYIKPTGSINISENGTFDVTEKSSVNVDVPIPSGDMYAKHIVDFTLNASTLFSTIMSTYVKECANFVIYPTDANNTKINTIVIGESYNTAGEIGTITTPTGVTISAAIGQYKVNDQSYNAVRIRGNVGNKPAGNYRLVYYGVPK